MIRRGGRRLESAALDAEALLPVGRSQGSIRVLRASWIRSGGFERSRRWPDAGY